MSLYLRLIGGTLPENAPKIAIHQFMAMISEVEKGKITGAQAASIMGLNAAEQAEATTLINKVLTPPTSISLGGFVTLTNIGTAYDAIPASQGLGIARLQTAGITEVEFTVAVNKVGTGTQDWQLWNQTDAVEIALVSDNGAAGVKVLTTTRTLSTPMAAGLKTLRVRAKSSNTNDDPIFMGGALLVYRIERMTPVDLHEVLLLAEYQWAYGTEAELKARLGVP